MGAYLFSLGQSLVVYLSPLGHWLGCVYVFSLMSPFDFITKIAPLFIYLPVCFFHRFMQEKSRALSRTYQSIWTRPVSDVDLDCSSVLFEKRSQDKGCFFWAPFLLLNYSSVSGHHFRLWMSLLLAASSASGCLFCLWMPILAQTALKCDIAELCTTIHL